MNREIEAKMRLSDIPGLEAKLRGGGAELLGVIEEVNTYFDTPEGSLRASDQGLRMRRAKDDRGGEQITVTHKGPRALGQLKDRAEAELVVDDADQAVELLAALGYVRTLVFEKLRRRWRLAGCYVEIDTLPYLGDFVEIEGPGEERVMGVREKLGLGELPMIQHSYASMLKTYLAENHVTDTYVGLGRESARG